MAQQQPQLHHRPQLSHAALCETRGVPDATFTTRVEADDAHVQKEAARAFVEREFISRVCSGGGANGLARSADASRCTLRADGRVTVPLTGIANIASSLVDEVTRTTGLPLELFSFGVRSGLGERLSEAYITVPSDALLNKLQRQRDEAALRDLHRSQPPRPSSCTRLCNGLRTTLRLTLCLLILAAALVLAWSVATGDFSRELSLFREALRAFETDF